MKIETALNLIKTEVARATKKFPTWPTDPIHAHEVLLEEVGELGKEVLQYTYEPHKTHIDAVRKEAIQTAAMAVRFLMSLDKYKYHPGEQHHQSPCSDGCEHEEIMREIGN